jgi:hypothetical protein
MVNKRMYKEIQVMKNSGFNISQISEKLLIDRKTVRKYYRMSETEYQNYLTNLAERDRLLDPYKLDILKIYQDNGHIKLNMAGVYDCLMEKYGDLPCTEKSLRNLIWHLQEKGELVLTKPCRHYTRVPELPYGKQLQLDFGFYTMPSGLKLFMFTAVLSASRYKCVFFHDKPFTTLTLISYLLDCFDFIGGIPQEIVIDQDKIMVVSENAGDILYTKEFGSFKEEMGFSMYVCRKADPESKGKVENLVGFVKKNFLRLRRFVNLEEARVSVFAWLKRRANGRLSYATGRIPAILHEEEKKHLKPLKSSIFRKDRMIYREERQVSEHSFISHASSQYSVPVRYRLRTVEIFTVSGNLLIFDPKTGEQIAEHTLSVLPGQKISSRTHFRENETDVNELKERTLSMFAMPLWEEFVRLNFKAFPRFVRDQCLLCRKLFSGEIRQDILMHSLSVCLDHQCYAFKDLKSAYDSRLRSEDPDTESPPMRSPLLGQYRGITVHQREIQIYSQEAEVRQ